MEYELPIKAIREMIANVVVYRSYLDEVKGHGKGKSFLSWTYYHTLLQTKIIEEEC